jgi:DNA primase
MRQRSALVMEGYMDVIMAHQHGFRTAVAGLGTAFTPDHATLLRRHADRIVLVYDGDAAGRRATGRALEALVDAEGEVRVATLPDGLDPCDLLVQRGADAFRAAMEGAPDAFDHMLDEAAERHGVQSPAGAAAAADEILDAVLRVSHPVKREAMLRRLGGRYGFTEDQVRRRAREREAAARPPVPAPAAASAAPRPDPLASLAPVDLRLLRAALSGPGLAARLAAAALDDPHLADALAELATISTAGGPAEMVREFEECLARRSHEGGLAEARRRFAAAQAAGDAPGEARWLAEIQRMQADRKGRRSRTG